MLQVEVKVARLARQRPMVQGRSRRADLFPPLLHVVVAVGLQTTAATLLTGIIWQVVACK